MNPFDFPKTGRASELGLYDPLWEHDACGVGFVATLRGTATRKIVELGLTALGRLEHRGGTGADSETGDGSGLMIDLPELFLRRTANQLGVALPAAGSFAVGQLFLPQNREDRMACQAVLEDEVRASSMVVLGWRDVPCRAGALGVIARASQPAVRQCFIADNNRPPDLFEAALYPLRKRLEARVSQLALRSSHSRELFCVVSLSNRTLTYKGQLTAAQLASFYPDLEADDLLSRFAVFHQRFSTNTQPSWRLAQPFRFIAHNGEINTLRGNRSWMKARGGSWQHRICGIEPAAILPVIESGGSDSAAFDNTVELLVRSGRSLPAALMMMMPEAWEEASQLSSALRGFYAYHANLLEPWDGPAAIAFGNGRLVGAALDRNGLRPARYSLDRSGLVVLASEAGVVDIPPAEVVELGRLSPGQMIAVDLDRGRLLRNSDLKGQAAEESPWEVWERTSVIRLDDEPGLPEEIELPAPSLAGLGPNHRCFGYSEEELQGSLGFAATGGHELVASMGDDTALASLSGRPQLIFDYFSQGFAQVTNPPIDSIRERRVMSLRTTLGPGGDLLAAPPAVPPRVELAAPVLTDVGLARLREVEVSRLICRTLPALFSASSGPRAMENALTELALEAEEAVAQGVTVLVLSDRDVGPDLAPIPSLLALGRVHHHLLGLALRTKLSLVVESAEPRSVHHVACLIGHGAEAVNPYLALETVAAMATEGELPESRSRAQARDAYVAMLNEGLLKVISKMGISTLASYCGAQVFEAVGIAQSVIELCFPGTPSRIGGVGMDRLTEDALRRHRAGYGLGGTEADPEVGGEHRWRVGAAAHAWNPESVAALQQAARGNSGSRYEDFRRLADAEDGPPVALRHLLRPVGGPAVPLEEVEPASAIVRRFATGAMSLGALGKEAHETLAIAMNRLGGKSNTGEGGEDPGRYRLAEGDGTRRSAVKQVASGRFGVTLEYLVNSDDIQIKMAQGAKPGEGGQLPGHKVYPWIAATRHSTPGVGLISPPPHHDIYSIEDLAQLIHDLKNANPLARVHVKLVAEMGVGTVAAGVSKAHADVVLISGHDGGTGASPLTSIKHAGGPWEIRLAETQQTLLRNGLRDRIVVQVDGQLKTGRDVIIAALLGAEEFGFATAPLVVAGCVLMRVCHLDTCPVGVATQNPELRRRFTGKPEFIVSFFEFLAQEVREYLAALGFRTLQEAVGHAELLDPVAAISHWKAGGLDLTPVLHVPELPSDAARHCQRGQDHGLENALDNTLILLAEGALTEGRPVRLELPVRNVNRTVGTMLGSELTRRWGGDGLPDDTIEVALTGSAGQSLGAFLPRGITLRLRGDANDYVGKGLSGGRIIAAPDPAAPFAAHHNIIAGNVIGYGATSGELLLRGVVGERFCVRNSGATAVAEGTGDHGCEYMTGGRVVVLGPVGRNFAAGMSGGIAYLLDPDPRNVNTGIADLEQLTADDADFLRELISRHHAETGSTVAARLLADWDSALSRFARVMPRDYKRVLDAAQRAERDGVDVSTAVMAAASG